MKVKAYLQFRPYLLYSPRIWMALKTGFVRDFTLKMIGAVHRLSVSIIKKRQTWETIYISFGKPFFEGKPLKRGSLNIRQRYSPPLHSSIKSLDISLFRFQ